MSGTRSKSGNHFDQWHDSPNQLYTSVAGRAPLDHNEMCFFREIVTVKAEEIVHKWIDFFVLHKPVTFERINRRLK